jgi:1,4-alpha-glucan branching enzyme
MAHILHVSEATKILAFHRWEDEGGPNNDVIVVCNFSAEARMGYRIALPKEARFENLFNTSAKTYNDNFSDIGPPALEAEPVEADGRGQSALVDIGPYSILVYGLV